MHKLLTILLLALLLSSCAFVHKIDIEQGNVFTNEMVSKLHRGMSEAQVKEIMGTPILLNTFSDNRVEYIYTFRTGHKKMVKKDVTLIFDHGVLKDIAQGNTL